MRQAPNMARADMVNTAANGRRIPRALRGPGTFDKASLSPLAASIFPLPVSLHATPPHPRQ